MKAFSDVLEPSNFERVMQKENLICRVFSFGPCRKINGKLRPETCQARRVT